MNTKEICFNFFGEQFKSRQKIQCFQNNQIMIQGHFSQMKSFVSILHYIDKEVSTSTLFYYGKICSLSDYETIKKEGNTIVYKNKKNNITFSVSAKREFCFIGDVDSFVSLLFNQNNNFISITYTG